MKAFTLLAVAMMTAGCIDRPDRELAAATGRHPFEPGESLFFRALLVEPELRDQSLDALTRELLGSVAPEPRSVLLLGMNHLWLMAENQPDLAARHRHAVLASHWLRTAEALNPTDDRIPTWRLSAEWAAARIEGRYGDADRVRDEVVQLAERDPCFHSVTLGIMSYDEAAETPAFQTALAALEAAFDCGADDPSGKDLPLWPHNVHGFLLLLADFRIKAGDLAGAESALMIAEARTGFEDWLFRSEVESRLTYVWEVRTLGTTERGTPEFIFRPSRIGSCVACHGQ